jgi:hypothetical protein
VAEALVDEDEDGDEDELLRSEDISITKSEELGISFEHTARWHALSKSFDRPWF